MIVSQTAFFSLENFAYKDLFENEEFVWGALIRLEEYLQKQSLGKIETKVPSGAYLENASQITIGKGTVIESGAYIRGPCIIGKDCSIRHGAYIRGNVITGDRCVIGHCSEVKNSILLHRAHAAHFAYVGDSILGNDVNLGAGVKCANVRLDQKEIEVSFNERTVKTGLVKLGAIIGDFSQIGCNAVLNPATFIGKGAICYPSLNIGGYVPSFAYVKSSSKIIFRERKEGKTF